MNRILCLAMLCMMLMSSSVKPGGVLNKGYRTVYKVKWSLYYYTSGSGERDRTYEELFETYELAQEYASKLKHAATVLRFGRDLIPIISQVEINTDWECKK